MKTNDLKKGMWVLLACGWHGKLLDNGRGTTRLVDVYGIEHEAGSVYAHDIVAYADKPKTMLEAHPGAFQWLTGIEYTPAQLKCKEMVKALGM